MHLYTAACLVFLPALLPGQLGQVVVSLDCGDQAKFMQVLYLGLQQADVSHRRTHGVVSLEFLLLEVEQVFCKFFVLLVLALLKIGCCLTEGVELAFDHHTVLHFKRSALRE